MFRSRLWSTNTFSQSWQSSSQMDPSAESSFRTSDLLLQHHGPQSVKHGKHCSNDSFNLLFPLCSLLPLVFRYVLLPYLSNDDFFLSFPSVSSFLRSFFFSGPRIFQDSCHSRFRMTHQQMMLFNNNNKGTIKLVHPEAKMMKTRNSSEPENSQAEMVGILHSSISTAPYRDCQCYYHKLSHSDL